MCLGESTTANQYPTFLEETLNQRKIGIKFSVIDKGVSGTITSDILAELEPNLNQYYPDIVVTMMGINDVGVMYYKDIPQTNTVAFRYCKAYRFIRLIYMHILYKLKGEGIYGFDKPDTKRRAILKRTETVVDKKIFSIKTPLKKNIRLEAKDDGADIGLEWSYQNQENFLHVENSFKRAIELSPKNDGAYVGLGWLYQTQGKLSQAEGAFKKAVELDPKDDRIYGTLSVLYEEIGKPELAKEYAQKANRLRLGSYVSITVNNYRKLKEVLDKKGIKLVCMQYPMRSIQPLKKIFENQEGTVIFVDNEKIFRDAVKKNGYNAYFIDMFGGEFGHCTDNGNRLLAESIANVILKEVLHK